MDILATLLAEGRVSNEEGRHLGMKHVFTRLKTSGKVRRSVNVNGGLQGLQVLTESTDGRGPHPDSAT